MPDPAPAYTADQLAADIQAEADAFQRARQLFADAFVALAQVKGDEIAATHLRGWAENLERRLRPPARPTKRKLSGAHRRRIMERDEYRCQACGTHRDLSVDHILAEVNGGTDEDENLQTLCRPCNSRKGTR